jgi:tripartite ATP-independent transporter DctP family solute receptor
MTLKIFPGAQLGDFKAMVGQTQAGDLDIVMTGYPDMSYIIPELKLIGAPYVVSSYEHLKKVVKGPYGQRMDTKFREKGIHMMDVWYEGARHTTANKPINSMADLKGLKMRTPNVPFLIAYAQAVGATPAPVAFAELYMALQTKQVDAQENPLPTIEATKVYEVQKHIALTGHFISSSAILVGDKALKKLNPTQKQWLEEAILAGGKVATAGVMKSETDLVAFFKSKGLGVTTVDTAPFRAAMKTYYDTLETEFGKGEIARIMATN